MLAAVKRPRIRVYARVIPRPLIEFLRENYGGVEIDMDANLPDESRKPAGSRRKDSSGKAVARDRAAAGMTQAELARMLGVAVTVVSDIENGRRTVSRKMAVKLGGVFGSDPSTYFEF